MPRLFGWGGDLALFEHHRHFTMLLITGAASALLALSALGRDGGGASSSWSWSPYSSAVIKITDDRYMFDSGMGLKYKSMDPF